MKIKTRVKIAGALVICVLLAYGAMVLYLDRAMSQLAQEVRESNEIVNKITILRNLTQDYLLYHTERAQRQWSAVYDEVLRLLDNREYRLLNSEYGFGDAPQKLKIVGDTFSRLMSVQPTTGFDNPGGGAKGELQNRLTTQLLLATQDLLTRFFNLTETINGKLISTQRLISFMDILALLVLGILLISNTVLLQRAVVKPVLQLHAGAEIIGAGNLDYKVGTTSKDEIGELSRAFDRMTTNLQKVTVSRDELVREMAERQQAEEALRDRSAELARVVADLEEKSAEMERFTYMVSHDLKSPLVTISTFLGFLEDDLRVGDTGRIDKDMQFMRTAADKMGQLLSELLEMSRIGRMVNPPVEVTFQELVQEVLQAVAGPIAARGMEVQVNEGDVTLFGDQPRLVEIWQNLVENAVNYMGEQAKPRLTIGLERQGSDTVFFVCDNGIGIEPQYQEKIFGIFEKLDSKSGGTGIGLAVVKRIVELYQGTIWVESPGLGQGACLRFTLPGAVRGSERGK
jgi:signal transduction histidine kinase